MYADDNADKLAGIHRQIMAISHSPMLDPEDLQVVYGALRRTIDQAEHDAITGLRASGVSWAEIGRALRMTRQASQQRFSARAQ